MSANRSKKPKLLFFTKGARLTDLERQQLERFPCEVMVRNGSAVVTKAERDGTGKNQAVASDTLEECDGVFGAVPEAYADKPNALDVVRERLEWFESDGEPSTDQPVKPPFAGGTKPVWGNR